MSQDKYSAVWVSHSSISDYLKCPRAYYLNNIYRDPSTGHKITIMSAPLALGQVVHEVVESLSVLPTNERFKEPLAEKFERAWKKVSGLKGGFTNEAQEAEYKERGLAMVQRVSQNPGPLARLAVKIKMDLPHFWLSEEDNIILCGKLDWMEYLPDIDAVHIIDFKTSKRDEEDGSLQLPIYYLLATNCQKRRVVKASYWYLERNNSLSERPLPDLDEAREKVLSIAKEIKLKRKLDKLACKEGNGCRACRPLEQVVNGQATLVGVNDFNQDVYILSKPEGAIVQESEIL